MEFNSHWNMTRLMKDIADAEIDEKNSFSDYY